MDVVGESRPLHDVGAIVSLFKRVRAAGGKFEVANLHGQPRSIFKVLRLDKVFNIDT